MFARASRILDGTTMYRVVLYALGALAAIALVLGALGFTEPFSLGELVGSLVVAVSVGLGLNVLLARLCAVGANHESALITALIIFFLVPPQELSGVWVVALASAAAIVSKYVIAVRGQHLLNPAAVGALVVTVLATVDPFGLSVSEAVWWVASQSLFLPLLAASLIVVWKVRRWELFITFMGVGLVVFLLEELRLAGWTLEAGALAQDARVYLTSWPALFLGAFMLTEPFTIPPRRTQRLLYAALVALLLNTTLLSPAAFPMSPELALLIGNLAFFPATLRRKLSLRFVESREVADHTLELVFDKPEGLHFSPGQYLEWTLPHAGSDNRGIRRYFTIASSPTEDEVVLGVKFGERVSSFKQALLDLAPGDEVVAAQRAGDFLLPTDPSEKLAFVAGGIGITPFRSMTRFLIDTDDPRDITLLYANNTRAEICWQELWAEAAEHMPFSVVHAIARERPRELPAGIEHGYLTAEIIRRRVPDYAERTWYLSGPHGMVVAYQKLLTSLGVPNRQIRSDYFPGLA
ncbi:hypothetical protein GVX82_02850 [Patescibacteria group bacterium]|jgi:ferredoxin-NADP reductase/Na+-translocating ferredoxin:NAD+ oxidoreductase RnfD subunit|nr:hypothetical protein [Patescibacteria group bacterium]